ncbi:hypothetical protein [Gallid alphaherpesvirus 2]|uniref:Uncharacterized protein n=1 Tax=Gallid alphaherpesvirus 2 TaxID=10390 RepID=I6TBJ8_9ALPH|nr:hypothetical protein [Gallid alphaherpesvirus 2]AFM75624.1 hypothetical protein [Gallid alphaherpesvirus 2]
MYPVWLLDFVLHLVCVLEMQCWHLNYLKYTGAGTNLIPHFAIGGGGNREH